MLTTLKEILGALLMPLSIPAAYVGGFFTMVTSIFRRAEWGLFVLVVLIPMANVRYKLLDYPFGKDLIDIILFSVLAGLYINKQGILRSQNSLFLIGFILINYISLWNASLLFDLPLPLTTENELLRDWKNYVEMIFLYFLTIGAIQEEKQQKTMIILIAVSILFLAVREFRNFSPSDAFSYDSRAEGPFWVLGLGANHFGAFMAHYCSALLGLLLVDDHKQRRWLYLATILFGLHPLFFSYSRGAYLGALIAVTFFGIVKKRKLLLLVVGLIVFWQAVLPPTVVERISMTESGGKLEPSAASRVDLWDHAYNLFTEHPVFGVGFGAFGLTVPAGSLTDTHNFYMRTLSEQGLIGLLFFLLVLLGALRSGLRLYRDGPTPFQQALGLGFMGCVVATAVTNLFGDRWSYFVLGGYFFILWGLVDRSLLNIQKPPLPAADNPPDLSGRSA